jgi:hypothetical protein
MRLLLIAAVAAPAFANPGFNGRWDIKVDTPNKRAWWLEITGAETPNPKGKFVSAFAGDMNVIEEISIKGDDLTFGFRPPKRGHLVYKAKLAKGKLEGTFEEEGAGRPPLPWTAVRAPVIKEKDDASWQRGKPVDLFGGTMSGWRPVVPGKALGWAISKEGTLTNTAGANNLVSEAKFWNFELHAEYRVGAHSNSGIGLRGRYEIQILEDYGKPPDTHSNGSLYSRVAPAVNASKPAGEWQTYDIRLVGRTVTVVLNGKKILDKVEIEGLTAIAPDSNEAEPGPIFLQGDHGPVEFRKLTLTPLTKKGS